MTCLEKTTHYINAMLFYFENMIYDESKKEDRAHYINDQVDKVFEFEKWINRISDDEIMYECDYDDEITPEDIREGVKTLIKKWVNDNCENFAKGE